MSQELFDEFQRTKRRMFKEASERLPDDEKPAPEGVEFCGSQHDGWSCTKPKHEDAKHVAHSSLGAVLERW